RAVARVRNPDGPVAYRDSGRRVSDGVVLHLPVRVRRDPRDGAVQAVRDPDVVSADGEPLGPVSDVDRLLDAVALGIHLGHGSVAARNPNVPAPEATPCGASMPVA